MAFRSISGGRIIGSGKPQPTPITLDPIPYEGSLVYGDDGNVYLSNGTAWVELGPAGATVQGVQGLDGLQGLQGAYGPGFTIIGSVPDVDSGGDPQATLNTAFPGASVGDGVIDDADDELWIYDGTNWINIGSFRGVQGFDGPQGIQGVQGTIGEEGIQGSRGYRGFQGIQGMQGTKGHQGTQGIQGPQGTQGVQGVQGVQGTQGVQGLQGVQGIQGIQGIQGTTGIQGDTGFQGFAGDDSGSVLEFNFVDSITEADPGQGNIIFNDPAANTANFANTTQIWIDDLDAYGADISGLLTALDNSSSTNKGYAKLTKRNNPNDYVIFSVQELTDTSGYWELDVTYVAGDALKSDFIGAPLLVDFSVSGDRGFQGIQGMQGTKGHQGVQGIQGPRNFQGVQGPQGMQGTIGIQGVQGVQGLLGNQGVQGPQGTQGVQGIQGVQGSKGTQGIQGFQGFQGTQGFQGVQGGSGLQGVQGIQGDVGFQGMQGFTGYNGGLTYTWDFNNSTTEGFPGLNSWLLNNADVTAADKLYIDDLTDSGRRVDDLFNYLDSTTSSPKGQIFIRTPKDPATGNYQFLIYEYTDWVWGVTGTGSDWGHFVINLIERSELEGSDLSPGTDWDAGAAQIYGNTAVFNFVPAGQKGTQGIQGTTGIQGVQGSLGTQGIQGPQSVQGVQGILGAQGVAGSYGGASFEYDFSSDTLPTGPAGGIFKFNNTDITAATIFRISETDTYGNDLAAFLATLDDNSSSTKCFIKLSSVADPTEFALYGMTSQTDAGSYVNMSVTFLAKSTGMDATYLTNNTDTIVSFTTSGDAGVQGIQGPQGTQGIQGDLGIQGATGAGSQGVQGVQGDLGFQGTQGFPGPIGPQGIQGVDGLQGGSGTQGATGSFGGITFDYTFSNATAKADPGPGFLRLNNATFSSATALYIDDRDDGFTDIQTYLRTIDDSTSPLKGHFRISEKLDPANFVVFTVSALVEESGYFDITCAHVTGSVSTLPDGTDIIITFARTGDIGPAGPQGVQGFDGFQGAQGTDGVGAQGTQGAQGMQGPTAAQGVQGTAGFVGGDGTQGSQGTQGVQGVQGIAGVDGQEGAQGFQGLQGRTGAQGIQGVGNQGTQGIAGIGATGIQGFQGIQGVANQGVQGVQGNDGPPGFGNQGTQGFQGFQGTKGDIGAQGTQGVGGQGTSGAQGVQGIQGTIAAQGIQGVSGTGNQGTQGTQGAAGIGNTGIQGDTGFQGIQGLIGGTGGDGLQGPQGTNGFQGLQGIDGGLGNDGPQGIQGIQGDVGFQGPPGIGSQGIQGMQGVQGEIGIQGPPGQGTQGIQGIQAAQGVQGERGFQGTQGVQGPGIQGGVENIQNVHESGVQDTALFITMVEAGASHRPLLGTLGPNPGGESNFFYQSDIDTLTVENLEVIGNLTVTGVSELPTISGISGNISIPSDNYVGFGGSSGSEYILLEYETSSTSFIVDTNTSLTSNISFRAQGGSDVFTFNMQTGDFTATGDVTTNSDARLKENVETIDNALEKVSNMRGVYYNMIAKPDVRKVGVIAQEVEEVLPEAVITAQGDDDTKSVSYGNIVGLLIEAIKDLKKDVDDLKAQ